MRIRDFYFDFFNLQILMILWYAHKVLTSAFFLIVNFLNLFFLSLLAAEVPKEPFSHSTPIPLEFPT